MKAQIYLAAPLFSEAERNFNVALARTLEGFFEVYLPQRDGRLFVELVRRAQTIQQARAEVFQSDLAAIDASSILLIVLDGRSVDEGACFELGYAYAKGKTCVALQTDVRRLLPLGNNPMIDSAVSHSFKSVEDLVAWLRRTMVASQIST